MYNYNLQDKIFNCLQSNPGSSVNHETVFHYRQQDNIVWATYKGGDVQMGTLLARIERNGTLSMNYQHINSDGDFMTGVCHTKIETMPDGKYRLHENWQWTVDDYSEGTSVLQQI